MGQGPEPEASEQQAGFVVSEGLKLDIIKLKLLNEVQHRFFTDFVFQWRFYINDHTLWQYPLAFFRRFGRLAFYVLLHVTWKY